ncbi:hypothetical protein DI333_06195 [Salmonella enterica subsp. enterica serovar Oranienburg]|uniref:hypothetical protein n=1 Tax=Salmonella enterica TaxID=28901 RepID=UPI0012FDA3D5|nr:hypothetical protein [Salmonella enterica]EDV1506045.1 hypothetical protein [Salmonella enterica subsp. salamae]EEA5813292.1 hypothetical protein [Salmonella enterica subsp. enterica serovar Oranienburg]EED7441386.1 hypothetical protein [Salmonella enterica subsp. salamae]EEI9684418.1 hypothetical protein [Salmonella enterica]EKN4992901.1 hypothetical protein [Salmonella enterica]
MNGTLRFRQKQFLKTAAQWLLVAEGAVLIIAGWLLLLWVSWEIMYFLHPGR